ncbi:MAG: ATP-binding protein [Planctomycetota bacterium]|nr:ATP-binding protein [Planctomycetota bacterium]MCX8039349.1 ATP-binding protein [Planctomycetota bacterium]MDW8373640.1 ATP-binding protein [Planctomycetota bacterium]
MLKLEVLNTAAKGKTIPLKSGFTVGSAAGCTLRAQHPALLPQHARFVQDQGLLWVEAASAGAPLVVNGRPVARHALRHRDELVIGPLRLLVIDDTQISHPNLSLDTLLSELEQDPGEIYDFAKEDLFYLVQKDPTLKRAINFVIPSKDRFIDQAQVFLARLVKGLDMDEQQIDAFMTCTKELILNAHRHGHKYDESKFITLRWRDLGERVQLTIEDQGPGFDHRAVLAKARSKDAATAARERYQAGGYGGLGFKLILQMADSLIYNDAGNVVCFTVRKRAAAD